MRSPAPYLKPYAIAFEYASIWTLMSIYKIAYSWSLDTYPHHQSRSDIGNQIQRSSVSIIVMAVGFLQHRSHLIRLA